MRALVWDGTNACVVDRPVPRGDDDLAVVRVALAGVCSTDLEIARGYMGFRGVLGHEFVGTVIEGPAPWADQRVVGEINFPCGACPVCDRGMRRHCPSRQVMGILDADGAIAEYVAVPVANLHAVPDAVPDDVAVFAEPVAAGFAILDQLDIKKGQSCTVLGDGKLGLLVAQVMNQSGAHVLAVGRHASKLAILERRGIDTCLLDDWDGERSELVVEATGSSDGFRRALAATCPRGTLVLKSTVAEIPEVDLAPVVIDEIRVVGSRCGPFPPALAALEADRIEVRALIDERIPLARADEALCRAGSAGALKVLIECG